MAQNQGPHPKANWLILIVWDANSDSSAGGRDQVIVARTHLSVSLLNLTCVECARVKSVQQTGLSFLRLVVNRKLMQPSHQTNQHLATIFSLPQVLEHARTGGPKLNLMLGASLVISPYPPKIWICFHLRFYFWGLAHHDMEIQWPSHYLPYLLCPAEHNIQLPCCDRC